MINKAMMEILKGSPLDPYDARVDGYFGSIGEIVDHYYKSDIVWINAISTIRDFKVRSAGLLGTVIKGGERLFAGLGSYCEKRSGLDRIIMDFMDEMTEDDMNREFSRVNSAGERQTKLVWKSLIHMFNHETHHRGQISQILDSMKIENDYSNMIRID
jgi:uncharacterized damage-inducible protein DinB